MELLDQWHISVWVMGPPRGGKLAKLSIAPMRIAQLPDEKKPNACESCRSCEAVCPQQIKISTILSEFSSKLGG